MPTRLLGNRSFAVRSAGSKVVARVNDTTRVSPDENVQAVS